MGYDQALEGTGGMNDKLKATLSPFDSELFGCKVGKLEGKGIIPVRMVRESNGEFDVVFVKTTGWQEPRTGNPVALDWRFDMQVENGSRKSVGEPMVQGLAGPLASHLEIAATAFADSRFLRDPVLAQKVPELYRRWLIHGTGFWSLSGPQAEDGFLVQDADADGYERIALIGVGENCRGMGLGERLAIGVMNQAPNARGWRVTVAARNWRAIRFYEGLGFRVQECTTAFHVWI